MGKKRSRRRCRLAKDVKNVRRSKAGNPTTEAKGNENFSSRLKVVLVLCPKMTNTKSELAIC